MSNPVYILTHYIHGYSSAAGEASDSSNVSWRRAIKCQVVCTSFLIGSEAPIVKAYYPLSI